jgi:DNA-binding MarR family transcriptional regulator
LSQHEPIGLLIGVARRRIKQAVGQRVRPWRLTPQQFWLLVGIHEEGGPSLSDLAERRRVDQPTASRVMAALVRRKLVRAEEDPRDRRRARFVCTPAGEALQPALGALANEIRRAVIDGLDDATQEAVRAGLRRVIDNMDRLEKAAPAPRARGRRRG